MRGVQAVRSRSDKPLPVVDLVRSFSILAVLAVHSSSYLRPLSDPFFQDLFQHFQRNGPYGVYLFFLVSGFLITRSIDHNSKGLFKPDIRWFFARRAGRILPLLVLDILLGACVLYFLPKDSPRVNIIYGMGRDPIVPVFWLSILTFTYNWALLFWSGFLGAATHWSLLWSLSLEEQFYLLFPFALRWCGDRKRLLTVLVGTILVGFLWRLAMAWLFPFPWNYAAKYYVPVGVFDLMAMGVLLYLVFARSGPWFAAHRGWSLGLCGSGALILGTVYYGTSYSGNLDQVYAPSLLGIGLFLFLLGGLHCSFFQARVFRPLTLPGRYCYGMYLLHPTVLFGIGTLMPRSNGLVAFLIFSLVTLAIAGVSFEYFESPANRALRRWLGHGKAKGR